MRSKRVLARGAATLVLLLDDLRTRGVRRRGDECLGELAHVVVRRVRLVRLEHRELRVVPGRQPFVAEHTTDLVHARVPADEQALEMQLDGDAQVHVGMQRVPVRAVRHRGAATGDRLQDGRLDLEKRALLERRAQRADHARARREMTALRRVAEQVEVALAVPRLLVLEPVELLRRSDAVT